jgi:AraC-like DNA-binding protein/mannose-6-phosphate isomerase-like protein (cupin superfamily)
MSRKRREVVGDSNNSEDGLDIRSHALDFPPGHFIAAHSHDWHQLIYASRGVMTVNTATGSWVVPSRRAVWVPANETHEIRMTGSVSLRTLYLKVNRRKSLPTDCCVMNVSPLLRELILHTIQIGMLDRNIPSQARLIGVIIDQLQTISTIPLRLPMPSDQRAVRVAEILRQKPDDTRSIEQISKTVGAAKRTIERLFLSETDMTFGKWRQQLRLLHALRLLASGQSVTTVGFEVGYDSTSAFIAAFKNVFGTTPGRYYAELQTSQAGRS